MEGLPCVVGVLAGVCVGFGVKVGAGEAMNAFVGIAVADGEAVGPGVGVSAFTPGGTCQRKEPIAMRTATKARSSQRRAGRPPATLLFCATRVRNPCSPRDASRL